MTVRIIVGDAMDRLRELPDESAHCVVTSPPYWGLRCYGMDGQLGLEPTYQEHIANMVAVFREVRRVMRKDATLWLNYGDSFQDKQLQGIPWRIALALQADGWWLRSDIIWAKPNPMPESCTDRPTKAHEYLFLLTKSPRYYFDAEAIKEDAEARIQQRLTAPTDHPKAKLYGGQNFVDGGISTSRNKRSVWEIATSPYSEAHFATFPPALVEPCILAGTSAKGCCAKCGAPWVREVARAFVPQNGISEKALTNRNKPLDQSNSWQGFPRGTASNETLGWSPSCSCYSPEPTFDWARAMDKTVPCTVLDPFGGAGTTGLVADRLQRNAILIELNPEYAAMAAKRLQSDAPLFSQIAAE